MGGYLPANPRKLSGTVAARILEAVRLGMSQAGACRYAGISDETLRLWLDAGRAELATLAEQGADPATMHPDTLPRTAAFALAYDVALGEFEFARLGEIAAAAPKDWRAAGWLLERRLPDDYGKRAKVEQTVTIVTQVEELARQRGLSPEATAKLVDFAKEQEKRRRA